MSRTFVHLFALSSALVGHFHGAVWPQPKQIACIFDAASYVRLIYVYVFGTGAPSDTLFEAFERYEAIIFGSAGPTRRARELHSTSLVAGVDVNLSQTT